MSCDVLIKDNIKVELAYLNEGLWGDYNPDDPNDVPLIRFDVFVNRDGKWEILDGTSYCTLVPANAPNHCKRKMLEILTEAFVNALKTGMPIKRVAESLSWLSISDLL